MKSLILYSTTKLEDMLRKGNVWYVRHYESYFDHVYVVYLSGNACEPVVNGNTTLISLGTGNGLINLLLSPVRLYRFAKSVKPTHYLTADLVFSWWTSSLVKVLLKEMIVLMPVCMPAQNYRNMGRSLSGLPIWMESRMIEWSFRFASRVITGKNIEAFVNWLSRERHVVKKLLVVDLLVDELPSPGFRNNLQAARGAKRFKRLSLLYVGRLHKEKMVSDLIEVLKRLVELGVDSRLRIVGDGPERANLLKIAERLQVRTRIEFLGTVPSAELPQIYMCSDIFVSPFTGTSLREAALCRCPVVAYNIDWVKDFLVEGENALLAERGDIEGLCRQIRRLAMDPSLRQRLSENLHMTAVHLWGEEKLRSSLRSIFEREVSYEV